MRLAPTLTALAIAALALTGCSTSTTHAPAPTRESSTTAPIARPTSTPTPTTTTAPTTASTPAPVAAPLDTITAPCEEDEPCWDCATMGNLTCGPVADQQLPISATDNTPAPQPVAAPVAAPQPIKAPAPAPVATKPTATHTEPPVQTSVPCDQLKLGDGGTTQQHNCTPVPTSTPTPTPTSQTCPPILVKDGVNMTPPNAPAYCVYAQ